MTNTDTVTLLIQQRVRKTELPRYENWLKKITTEAARVPGHLGVHVIRPAAGGTEFSIIIRYESLDSANAWLRSEKRKELLSEISDAFSAAEDTKIQPGIEFWFTLPEAPHKVARPWKQWLITTSVIWPLSTLIGSAYKPLFHAVPILGTFGVAQLIVASTVVALTVFLIMPRYVRAVSSWLFR